MRNTHVSISRRRICDMHRRTSPIIIVESSQSILASSDSVERKRTKEKVKEREGERPIRAATSISRIDLERAFHFLPFFLSFYHFVDFFFFYLADNLTVLRF